MERLALFAAVLALIVVGSLFVQAQQTQIHETAIVYGTDSTQISTADIIPATLDSLGAVLVIGLDDGFKECNDSIAIFTTGATNIYSGLPWKGTLFPWAGRIMNPAASPGRDTSSTVYATPRGATSLMSLWDVRQFYGRGWEIGLHNRAWPHVVGDDIPDIWTNNGGLIETGDTTQWSYYNDIARGIEDLQLMGLPAPVAYSYAQASSCPFMFRYLKQLGFKCATSASALPHYAAGYTRWNLPDNLKIIRNGDNDYRVSLVRGALPHRYEIPHTISTTMTLAEAKETLDRAIEYNAGVVWILHRPSELTGTWASEFLLYADRKRRDGKLTSMTLTEMYEHYYNKTPSDICNLLPGNFEDTDSAATWDDGYRDMMVTVSDSFEVLANGWMETTEGNSYKALRLGLGHGRQVDGPNTANNRLAWRFIPTTRPGDKMCFQIMIQYDAARHTWNAGDSVFVTFKGFHNVREGTDGVVWNSTMWGGYSSYAGSYNLQRGGSPRNNPAAPTSDMASPVPSWASTTTGRWFTFRACTQCGDMDVQEVALQWDTAFGAKELIVSAPFLFAFNTKSRR